MLFILNKESYEPSPGPFRELNFSWNDNDEPDCAPSIVVRLRNLKEEYLKSLPKVLRDTDVIYWEIQELK